MKNFKKVFSVILAVAMLLCTLPLTSQAATFTDAKLTSRSDFLWGVSMHNERMNINAYPANDLINQIHKAAEMGSKLIRIDYHKYKSCVEDAVTLCNAYGIKVMLVVGITGLTFETARTADELAAITAEYKALCERFSEAKGLKVDYIQICNELDCQLMVAKYGSADAGNHSGSVKDNYDEADVDVVVAQVNAALAGMAQSDTTAQSVINITWTHYGFLEWLADKGVDYDLVGYGLYSNIINPDANLDFSEAATTIKNITGKQTIVVEANIRQTADTVATEDTDLAASAYDALISHMNQAYASSDVLGYLFYELVDQADKEKDTFNREAHFGLLKYDANGVLTAKPIYNRIKYIIGGTTLEKLTGPNANYQYNIHSEHEEINLKATKNYTKDYRLLDYMTYYNSTRFNEPIDITKAEYIEMDVYLSEAVDNFAVYFGTNATNDQDVAVGFYDAPNRATYVNGRNPKSAGWHHLVYKISSFNYKEANWDPTSMTGFILSANDYAADNTTAIQTAAIDIRVTNFALTREIPLGESTYIHSVYEYEIGKTSCIDGNIYTKNMFTSTAAGAVGGTWLFDNSDSIYMDATEADYFEFDMWVASDVSGLSVWMSNYISRTNGRKCYALPDLKGGVWNHVCVDIDDFISHIGTFDPAKFNSIYFEGATPTAVQFKVANVGLSKYTNNYILSEHSEIDFNFKYLAGVSGYNANGALDPTANTVSAAYRGQFPQYGTTMFSQAVDFTKADCIEFELYLGKKPENDFRFYISNNVFSPNVARAWTTMKASTLKQGWNHVILPTDGFTVEKNGVILGGVTYTYDATAIANCYFGGVPLNDMSEGLEVKFKKLSLTAVAGEKQDMVYSANVMSSYEAYTNETITAGTNLTSLAPIELQAPADLSKVDYLEFNLFVNSKCDISLHLSSAEVIDDISEEFDAVNTLDLQFGWNQIHIPVSEIINLENGWNANDFFESNLVYYIYFDGVPSAEKDSLFTVEDLAFTYDYGYEIAEGDFNTDGSVNLLDLVNIKKYLAASKDSFFANAAEITGEAKDGIINALDLGAVVNMLLSK